MNRRDTLPALVGLAATSVSLCGFAQQSAKLAHIGFLGTAPASSPGHVPALAAFRAGLRELGYAEGRNIQIEFRFSGGVPGRITEQAAELVRLKVDLIVAANTVATIAAKRATTTIPIVMLSSGDAVAAGLVASLAQPGGNVTGGSFMLPELSAKRLELLKETIPRATQVAVLFSATDRTQLEAALKAMDTAGQLLGLRLHRFDVRKADDLEAAFSLIAARRLDALALIEDPFVFVNAGTIANRAVADRLPSIGFSEFAQAGGLLSYGTDRLQAYHRAAYFVDKILKGAKPGDIPVEQPTRFECIVNLKTARALGIRIPQTVMLRTDKVIE